MVCVVELFVFIGDVLVGFVLLCLCRIRREWRAHRDQGARRFSVWRGEGDFDCDTKKPYLVAACSYRLVRTIPNPVADSESAQSTLLE